MALSVGISITLLACIGELAAFSGLLGIGNILLLVQRSRPRGSISPKSAVDYNGSVYIKDNYHWASSSSQISACSFEPGTIEDLGKALKILGDTRTPFAIKRGGHETNPGFSSTQGVQIAVYLFSDVTFDSNAQTATVGTALEEYGVNVVGAKVIGVGGGYSYLTNQYGLAIDNVAAYELVLPNGTVTTIASSNDPDLFFGLRGSLNNFGIVTHVTLKTYPQPQFWGGRISCSEDQLSAANTVIAAFTANPVLSNMLFYDAPTCSEGIFDDFLAIPHIDKDISTRSCVSFIQALPLNGTSGLKIWVLSIEEWTKSLLNDIANETLLYSAKLANASASIASYAVDPYLDSIYNHVDTPSAYPDSRRRGYSFLELYYAWINPNNDDLVYDTVATSSNHMEQVAITTGQDVGNVVVYPNEASPSTPLEDIYGENLARLQDIKKAVDPDNVMGLAGGWKL
ncbi:FAD-binding domain-containing protein [Suillus ampliporus]|nr:FAD-binding domain-containing protein [Suillus ampliporus]